MKTLSLYEYAKKVGWHWDFEPETLEEVQDYAGEYIGCTLWDFPLEELDDCLIEGKEVVKVQTEFGIRLCEL